MQAMIISCPDKVIEKIHNRLHRGATMINGAEGTIYNHQEGGNFDHSNTRAGVQ